MVVVSSSRGSSSGGSRGSSSGSGGGSHLGYGSADYPSYEGQVLGPGQLVPEVAKGLPGHRELVPEMRDQGLVAREPRHLVLQTTHFLLVTCTYVYMYTLFMCTVCMNVRMYA